MLQILEKRFLTHILGKKRNNDSTFSQSRKKEGFSIKILIMVAAEIIGIALARKKLSYPT